MKIISFKIKKIKNIYLNNNIITLMKVLLLYQFYLKGVKIIIILSSLI